MLVESQIGTRNIVQYSGRQQAKLALDPTKRFGKRDSTYDATVGTIISEGTKFTGSSYPLAPRGMVWIISEETFNLPNDITAIAALRTTWAHKGIFALNVGVVDPGWKGPVATALVNFSTEDFTVSFGDPFMRLMFFEHDPTPASTPVATGTNYLKQVKKNSRDFSKSFLNMEKLVDNVAQKIFSMPKWGVILALIAIIVALLAICLPIAYSLITGIYDDKVSIIKLQQRIELLEKAKPEGAPNSITTNTISKPETE